MAHPMAKYAVPLLAVESPGDKSWGFLTRLNVGSRLDLRFFISLLKVMPSLSQHILQPIDVRLVYGSIAESINEDFPLVRYAARGTTYLPLLMQLQNNVPECRPNSARSSRSLDPPGGYEVERP